MSTSKAYTPKWAEPIEGSSTVNSSGVIFSSTVGILPSFGVTKYSSSFFRLLSGFRSIQYLPTELSMIYLTTQSVVKSAVAAGTSSFATTFPCKGSTTASCFSEI